MKFYKAGNKFYETMKYEDAVSQFSSAIELEPSNPAFYYARGRAYEALGNNNEAKANFGKAIVFSPKYVDAYVKLGAVCNNLGQYNEALVYLNHATGLDKRNKAAYPEKVTTLLNLEKYDQALKSSDTALILIKDDPKTYHQRGLIYSKLNNDFSARKEFEKAISKDKSKRYFDPRIKLAELLLKGGDSQGAMAQCNEILKTDDRDTAAYTMRSKVFIANLDFPNAINDISKNIMIDKNKPEFYLRRGQYYQEFNQHTNAINDFTKYISLNPNDPKVYFARAYSYKEIRGFEEAMADYKKITVLLENDPETYRANKLLNDAKTELFNLNRETDAPEITILNPVPVNDSLEIRGDSKNYILTGKIKDKSKVKSLTINNEPVSFVEKNGICDFIATIPISTNDATIVFIAYDDYDNQKTLTYPIKRTEIIPPVIKIDAPYSVDGRIFLDVPAQVIEIQGNITDDSRIRSITVNEKNAGYVSAQINPDFSVTLNIADLDKFTVIAEDFYGNRSESEYLIDRTNITSGSDNPMGRTWVVFIENTGYENFAALEGPTKDINALRRALANYKIDLILHEKDMTLKQMNYFFTVDLRDKVLKNQVKSLLIWYSGHGKFTGENGYWIPVDAKREDELSYFNVSDLRSRLQGYGAVVVHTLVVSDACETGPGFYYATRAVGEIPTCDNSELIASKSAQVFTSAGEKVADDNSKFASSFSNTLMNNKNACIPIEKIVRTVKETVGTSKGRSPTFGKIMGLEDLNGTFFFIAK
jgi:tetratricopeptide (TPR) repeat protein